MSTQTKEVVIGDVVKWELPHEMARSKVHITCIPGATVGLIVGEILEPGGAVAQIHTFTTGADAPNSDAGTYALGYKGQWTTALAFNADAAAIKAAFEALSTVTDTITASAAHDNAVTITWTTAGKKAIIDYDGRLLTDGGIAMTSTTLDISTGGSVAASSAKIIATAANADYILLEKVTLADLKIGADIERAVISKGDALINGDSLFCLAAELAGSKTALIARGITIRTEPTIYQSGPPTS